MARAKKNASSQRKTAVSSKNNQLRIIAGQWRGRKLSFPDGEGLRPTNDRVRETLFNWLQDLVPNARCLDVFAGSGALGFEALSRGAKHAVLLDNNPSAIKSLHANAALLNVENIDIQHVDSLQWLDKAAPDSFDLVFLDPPFALPLLEPISQALDKGAWLAEGCAIYVESPVGTQFTTPDSWQLHREKQAGQVSYRLFIYSANK